LVEKIGKIDVLFIPVGGHFTIDARAAKKLVDKINPVIVFPMHYKTPVLDFPIAKKEEYLNLVDNVKEYSTNQIDLEEKDFSKSRTIILSYE
jgi:L-ascorbate metabolism protein UlaG (beta-lactamase superfamily)